MRSASPFALLLVAGWFVSSGCASTAPGATMEQLQRRVWLDSGCRPEQVVLLHVDSRTKALEGCGQRLIYVESCEHIRGEYSCTWVLDHASVATRSWRGGYATSPGGTPSYGSQPTPTAPAEDVIPPPPMPSPLPSEYMPTHL